MPVIFEYPHTVQADEIDDLGHVNNLVYVKWMLSAAVEHSSVQGWPPERYREAQAGWVVRSHFIEYLQPAFAGEQTVVRTWIADFKKVSSRRRYKIIRPADGTVLVTAETNWAFVGRERGLPMRIMPELRDAFEVCPTENEP